MSLRDHADNIMLKRVISPTRVTDDTAQVGQIIDRQGAKSVTYVIATGTLADANATFAVLLEHGDDSALADAAAVADADMISQTSGTAPETAAAFAFGDDDEVRKLGYVGDKRYTRLTITPSGNTGNADLAALAALEMEHVPVTQAAA